MQETAENAVVHVQNFDFRFDPGMPWVLRDVNLTCSKGSRTLLIGDDSTLHLPRTRLGAPDTRPPLLHEASLIIDVNTRNSSLLGRVFPKSRLCPMVENRRC